MQTIKFAYDKVWTKLIEFKREKGLTTQQALVCAVAVYNRDHPDQSPMVLSHAACANVETELTAYIKRMNEQEIIDLVGYATALINYES